MAKTTSSEVAPSRLLDLPTELLLLIFKEVFDCDAELFLIHPLLRVSRVARHNYINVFSGHIFLTHGTPAQVSLMFVHCT
jgi:hypothetical protein